MRPKKTRNIKCEPSERCFRPRCRPLKDLESVYLSLDEFEAIRLSDVEGLEQKEASVRMKISRPTFSRILVQGRKKVADALVNIKALRIEGGCCEIENK